MKNKVLIFIDATQYDYIEPIKHSFKDCEITSLPSPITPPELEKLAQKINATYSQVVFFDYYYDYYLLLPLISKKVKKKWIIKYSLPSLFNAALYSSFFQIVEYLERNLIDDIAVLDYNLYLAFKKAYNFSHIKLDIDLKKTAHHKDAVSIIGFDYLEENSFYNELSAITMTDFRKVYVENATNVTKNFGIDFGLTIEPIEDLYELMTTSRLNMYIKFFDINITNFLYSMDNGTLCLLGNTELLDDNEVLHKNLVLRSDDDIDEMSAKIKSCLENEEIILKEYAIWRKKYLKESQKTIKEFLDK